MNVLIVGVLGLCLGSFVNALVWRIKNKRNFVKERSECVNCHHMLSGKDLIPVVSWLALRGKCRYCSKPIHWQYPLVEALTAGLFIVSYIFLPYELSGVAAYVMYGLFLLIVTGCMALVLFDLKWMILPDSIVLSLTGLAALHFAVSLYSSDDIIASAVQLIASLAVSFGFFWALFQLSKGKWIGGGDVKFGLVYGLLLASPAQSVLVIFASSIIGCIIVLPLMITGKYGPKTKVPYGPMLIAATYVVYLWGEIVIDWYLNSIGIA